MCHRIVPLSYEQVLEVLRDLEQGLPLARTLKPIRKEDVIDPQSPLPGFNAETSAELEAPSAYPGSNVTLLVAAEGADAGSVGPIHDTVVEDERRAALEEFGVDAAALDAFAQWGKPTTPTLSDNFPVSLAAAGKMWGYQVSWQSQLIFNARIETALSGKGMWAQDIQTHRCLIPVFAFYENHYEMTPAGKERTTFICKDPDSSVALLAGIYHDDRFSLITTPASVQFERIHDRMPLMLSPAEAGVWMGKDFAQVATHIQPWLSLQEVT